MSAVDFVARGRAVRQRVLSRRLSTIDTLARGIAENLPAGLPGLIDVPIVEDRSSATQIASGTTYGFSSSTPASDFKHHFSFYGGLPVAYQTTKINIVSCHNGNGTDPSVTENARGGAIVRFSTFADKFEVIAQNYVGFRIKVNGKYLQDGMYGVAALNGDASGATRNFLFDFTGTEFEGQGLKQVELSSEIGRLGGVRVPIAYSVGPWPQALPIRAALAGDSMINTIADSGDSRTARHGYMSELLKYLTGIPDIWGFGNSGCGFVADQGGTRSNFLEQAAYDVPGANFDLVWEFGGRNDAGITGTQAAYQALVEEWIGIFLADNPDTLFILGGPLTVTTAEAYQASAGNALIQNAKKAAAARFPRNCAFIETAGNAVTNDPWIFGTGRQGATTGDGNADLVRGTDGVHPTIFGQQYLAQRIATETARVLPLLASRIRDGVIAGVNDADLS